MQLLVVNPSKRPLPDGAKAALSEIDWTVGVVDSYRSAIEAANAGHVDAVLVVEPETSSNAHTDRARLNELLRGLADDHIAAMMLTGDGRTAPAPVPGSLIDYVGRDITLPELRGRLAMIRQYHGLVQRMEQELRNMEGLGARLKQHFREVEQEMRLAGRLQRDFLPTCVEPIGPARFASLFRPASWVSGDIFDVVRIDETHTGVYVADAVGHGMAAGLLTMFIKRAMTPRREDRDGVHTLNPAEILVGLNDALAEQSLPNCQFVTACYGILDHETLRFSCARGGHPAPMHMRADGTVSELEPEGGLLGLFRGERFDVCDVQLARGDKILMYTDGFELAFQREGESHQASAYKAVFRELAPLRIDTALAEVGRRLDAQAGSIQPEDDMTIVGFEILTPNAA